MHNEQYGLQLSTTLNLFIIIQERANRRNNEPEISDSHLCLSCAKWETSSCFIVIPMVTVLMKLLN